jgi:hypothetical protein
VKVLLVLLGALVAAAAAPAGMIVPEPVDAVQPRWLVDGRHVEMSYAQAANGLVTAHQPYVAADDGGGFRPANSGDIVAHPDLAVSPDGAHRAWFGSDANLYLDGRALTTGRDGMSRGGSRSPGRPTASGSRSRGARAAVARPAPKST